MCLVFSRDQTRGLDYMEYVCSAHCLYFDGLLSEQHVEVSCSAELDCEPRRVKYSPHGSFNREH